MWDSVMFSSYYITNLIKSNMSVEEWIYRFVKHMEEYQEPKVISSERILEVLNNNDYLKAEGRCGWTVLGVAVSYNNVNLIKYFISKDATLVNSSANENQSVLNLAIEKKNIEAVKVLLELGANPNLKNRMDETYLETAERCKRNEEIIALLKTYTLSVAIPEVV